ncbi:flagellar hook protein FlgE [Aquisalimonas lutea]|uniref:flagellar hook protein FlgE n=1 Tax=Aquisalimonas lutea TaxID=1327750 RepID=UPI0025B4BE54|nr:flagellar hook protein FlgE [Aquisalimonas lutea]MDN3517984.1 flagellar hook protein FlgE [Aquisalimonas lutea]
MAFNTSLSGLNAAQSDLDVTSNNISNSETVGFKNSRAEFADVFASSQLGVASNAIGQGVRLNNVAQQFTQGQFDFTGNSLDLGINGEGFFRMSDQEGAISYTRNGAFQIDENGTIVNADGLQLTGYPADNNGNIGGNLAPLQVNTGNIEPQATGGMTVNANLTSEADEIDQTANPFDATDPETYNFSTSTTVYDSQGGAHEANFYFTHTDDAANEWGVNVRVDGQAPDNFSDQQTLTFNNDGSYAGIADASGDPENDPYQFNLGGGIDPIVADIDFSDTTQFGTPSAVNELNQDGYEAGEFAGLEVAENGTIFGRYTNGESQAMGQVPLARFPSEQNLTPQGDNMWTESAESGAPIVGAPGTSGLGGVEGGALEQSNVDITAELVNMITAQRNFQANAQMISTQDQVTQEILNIR